MKAPRRKNPKLSAVVNFPADNAGNIAAMLRKAADSIEAETDDDIRTVAIVAVQLGEDGSVRNYGWGQPGDTIKAIGILHLGVHRMIEGMSE